MGFLIFIPRTRDEKVSSLSAAVRSCLVFTERASTHGEEGTCWKCSWSNCVAIAVRALLWNICFVEDKKMVNKMHELIHMHVKRTLKRFTTQLIHLFIDVAQCSMYIRSTKTLHHVHPYSLWDYSVESWKRWQRPLIRTWSKHCHGKKCFSNRSTTKSLSCPRPSIRPKKALSM